jgi:hypothetical protein
MTSDPHDFFLVSGDSQLFGDPRKCWVEAAVADELGSNYLLVRIYPPAIDFRTKELINRILIVGKNRPVDLTELPVSVYISKVKEPAAIAKKRCSASSIEIVAAGDIFGSEEAAAAFAAAVA